MSSPFAVAVDCSVAIDDDSVSTAVLSALEEERFDSALQRRHGRRQCIHCDRVRLGRRKVGHNPLQRCHGRRQCIDCGFLGLGRRKVGHVPCNIVMDEERH